MTVVIETTSDNLQSALQGVFDGVNADFGELSYVDLLVQTHRDLEREHKAYWATESDPSGKPWPPLSPATVKKKGHSRILIDTTRLIRSLIGRNSDSIRDVISEPGPTGQHGLTYGTRVPYSIFHQVGGDRLPRRAHVGIHPTFLKKLVLTTAKWTVHKLKERRQ